MVTENSQQPRFCHEEWIDQLSQLLVTFKQFSTEFFKVLKVLFKKFGNHIVHYEVDNAKIKNFNFIDKVKFIFNSIYNCSEKRKIYKIIKNCKPDIIHVHNIFPLISLSIYSVLKKFNIPVLQSFHDHRLAGLCPQGNAFRDGEVCKKCFSGNYLYSIYYKCVKENFLLSIIYSISLFLNKRFKIIDNGINIAIHLFLNACEASKAIAIIGVTFGG